MKELSIFVDEAGDFGDYEKHNPYYIVTMVFHNQAAEIDEEIAVLNRNLQILKYGNNQAVHTEPLYKKRISI